MDKEVFRAEQMEPKNPGKGSRDLDYLPVGVRAFFYAPVVKEAEEGLYVLSPVVIRFLYARVLTVRELRKVGARGFFFRGRENGIHGPR